ncbi:MAG: cobalamin-dependent protein, partial [ANME-2 cluster archaeon]|nr:cobalamin-dependent protein [ANME-2 cluster archaeon]
GDNPEPTIILGGPHATILPEDTLTKVPEIDIIVRGEGEITIVELFDALENNKELQHINGITYRDNGIKSTPAQSPIMELNGTVPKSSDINNYIRRRLTLINADATLNQRLENNWKMGPCRCVYRYGKNVHALARVSKRSLPDVLIMISGVQFLLFAVLFDMQESKDKMRGDGARR